MNVLQNPGNIDIEKTPQKKATCLHTWYFLQTIKKCCLTLQVGHIACIN